VPLASATLDLLLFGVALAVSSCGSARAPLLRGVKRLWRRNRALPAPPRRSALRSPPLLRPGAVVALGPDDLVCEGVVSLDDDGRTTRLYRLVDGSRVRWLVVRPTAEALLCRAVEGALEEATAHTAPDQVEHDGDSYRLAARAPVRVRSLGQTSLASGDERGWLSEYAGPAGRGLVVLSHGERTHVLAGAALPPGLLDAYTTG